jgi:beta-galactosidase/beta-glucuronidase
MRLRNDARSATRVLGVRTVRVDGIKFLINEEPFSFKGFGKHEDVPVIGKGHNGAYLLHDFELLKWIGRILSVPPTTRTPRTFSIRPSGRAWC